MNEKYYKLYSAKKITRLLRQSFRRCTPLLLNDYCQLPIIEMKILMNIPLSMTEFSVRIRHDAHQGIYDRSYHTILDAWRDLHEV